MPSPETFTRRYQALLAHYGLKARRSSRDKANENGDVEQSHHRFKQAVDQALMLRGSRDFASRGDYQAFLKKLMAGRNANRKERLRRGNGRAVGPAGTPAGDGSAGQGAGRSGQHDPRRRQRLLGAQPADRRVGRGPRRGRTPRRLARPEGSTRLPRLRGRGKHRIEYRHVIDWLVRKPGAFEDYRYRDAMFPTSRFRMAYDVLKDQRPGRAVKEYLEILHLAARERESGVDEALRLLLDGGRPPDGEAVAEAAPPRPTAAGGDRRDDRGRGSDDVRRLLEPREDA